MTSRPEAVGLASGNRKVCFLTTVHPPFDVRVFHKEARSLAGAGYEVVLVAQHEGAETVEGVRVAALPRPKNRLDRMARLSFKALRIAVNERADVYHFHDPELIPVGLLLRAMGKRVVYDIHEDVPQTILDKHYLPRWSRRPLSWVVERAEGFSARWFSGLVAATPAIARRLGPLNRNAVFVQNFPLLDEFVSWSGMPWSQRPSAVACLGGITKGRGIRQMVEAMALLPDSLPVTLKLAGHFAPESLRAEVARMRGWTRVEELGWLDRQGVAEVLGQARAGLALLHPLFRYQLGYPVKMFEYMAARIPVIASDFPLWRQIVKGAGCGLLVNPLAPEEIAQAIEYLLTHPREAESMGIRGRKAVEEQYNWGKEERKLLQLYGRLLGGGLWHLDSK